MRLREEDLYYSPPPLTDNQSPFLDRFLISRVRPPQKSTSCRIIISTARGCQLLCAMEEEGREPNMGVSRDLSPSLSFSLSFSLLPLWAHASLCPNTDHRRLGRQSAWIHRREHSSSSDNPSSSSMIYDRLVLLTSLAGLSSVATSRSRYTYLEEKSQNFFMPSLLLPFSQFIISVIGLLCRLLPFFAPICHDVSGWLSFRAQTSIQVRAGPKRCF